MVRCRPQLADLSDEPVLASSVRGSSLPLFLPKETPRWLADDSNDTGEDAFTNEHNRLKGPVSDSARHHDERVDLTGLTTLRRQKTLRQQDDTGKPGPPGDRFAAVRAREIRQRGNRRRGVLDQGGSVTELKARLERS